MALNDLKSFDWRSIQKYLNPQSADDLNLFLEKLPQHAGQTVLIAAGIAWAMAGALGLYATIQAKALTELRAEFQKADALTPIVPKINNVPINETEVATFVKKIEKSYPDLKLQLNKSAVTITAGQTNKFAQFREAIGHMQNGGSGWRVMLDKLCVGRECSAAEKLGVSLKINKVSVENPTPTEAPAGNP